MTSERSSRSKALRIWKAGVAAVNAGRLVERALHVRGRSLQVAGREFDLSGISRIGVVGAGKASAAMAEALERTLGEQVLCEYSVSGFVNVPQADVRPLARVTLQAARSTAANEPTAEGVRATERILSFAGELTSDDLLICLISGGGSALLPAPAGAVTLDDKRRVTRLLHASGANIHEVNTVRKHLSDVKGGRLAQATKARVVGLLVSDVVDDDMAVIASGPTAVDKTTYSDALSVLSRHKLISRAPGRVVNHLRKGVRGDFSETLKRRSARVSNCVIGNNETALAEMVREATSLGYNVVNLGSCIEGDSRELGVFLAGVARGTQAQSGRPVCILSGGETTVRLGARPGKGGRNQELVLSALNHLREDMKPSITILSGGTDGEDGPTDAAGAVADAGVLRKSIRLGLTPTDYLDGNDSYNFFDQSGGLIRTGRTHTNVMDLRVILIDR